jgi:hypothetical protein
MQRGNEVGNLPISVGVLAPDTDVGHGGCGTPVLDLADLGPIPTRQLGQAPPGEPRMHADLTQAVTESLFGGLDAGR